MKKNIFFNTLSSALLLPLGISQVSAEPLPELSFRPKLNSVNSEDNSQNIRNTRMAQINTLAELVATKQPIGWSQKAFATPDSQATKLIGSSTSKVPNISTSDALATNSLNGLNSDGAFATEISINSINSEDNSQNIRETKMAEVTPSAGLAATKQPIGWSQRAFATPDSPATKLIGSPTLKIPNISTPGALGTNLLNGLNSDGKFVTGISIDTVPYLLFRGSGITLEEYKKNEGLQQFLSNFSLSIATDKETSSDTARVGIAAQFTILNQGDRRIDPEYSTVLNKFAATITEDNDFIDSLKDLPAEQRNQAIATRYKKWQDSPCEKELPCFTREIKRLEQKPIWTVAVGSSFITPNGRYSDLRGDGMGVWSTYRQGIGGNAQLIFHGAYRSGERITDSQGAFFNGDTLLLGARLRMGDETNSRYSLEAAYNLENRQGNSSNSYLTLGLGLEQKFIPQENLWFSFSFTAEPGRQNGSDFRFNSGVKWEFGSPGNI